MGMGFEQITRVPTGTLHTGSPDLKGDKGAPPLRICEFSSLPLQLGKTQHLKVSLAHRH